MCEEQVWQRQEAGQAYLYLVIHKEAAGGGLSS
jgi:hypothetical protein